MYAPLIQEDITITVTGSLASEMIAKAGLGHEHDDCWLLRDGTTTTDPRKALTDAIVVVAEGTAVADAIRTAADAAPADHGSAPKNTGTLEVAVDLSEMFVRPLGRDEALTLLNYEDSNLPDTRRRAGIILASNVGITASQIAALREIRVAEVQKVIAAFNEHGLASVGDQ